MKKVIQIFVLLSICHSSMSMVRENAGEFDIAIRDAYSVEFYSYSCNTQIKILREVLKKMDKKLLDLELAESRTPPYVTRKSYPEYLDEIIAQQMGLIVKRHHLRRRLRSREYGQNLRGRCDY